MRYSYYVYYQVEAQRADAVRVAVTRLQQGLSRATGIQGNLQCRRDKPQTWMEIYEGIEDAAVFEAALSEQLALSRFAEAMGEGARHTEVFRPL